MFTTANNAHQGHSPHIQHLHLQRYPEQNSPQPISHQNIPHPNGNAHPHPQPNGGPHNHNHAAQPPPQSHRAANAAQPQETVTVVGVPAVSIHEGRVVVGDSRSSSIRSYTLLKGLGDGSFGTVILCDWHGTLPPNTPLSPMQCSGGAKPEWAGKRLVAVKKMRRQWEGWDECKKVKELESLRAIPFHPSIIPLYDSFFVPDTKELYFVFESMEGNLYHLIRARRGRPLAGGLVATIFHQIVSGLNHIHAAGYFHRDMKPENVLVTTTGLFEYRSLSPTAPPNAPPEKDVVVIIKLADFGLARETQSQPPYTEYVSTRWYRAPEVLLLSRDYSNPVDMWALGTIMAELVNLRPLFPGSGQIDQIARICEILGDPAEGYGVDGRGRSLGGGKWDNGVRMANQIGIAFPKVQPRDVFSLFDRSIPHKLIECISDLLKYDPDTRLTSHQCLNHPYLYEALPKNTPPLSAGLSVQPASPIANGNAIHRSRSNISLPRSPYSLHPPIPNASSSHRSSFAPSTSTSSHTASSMGQLPDFINDLRIYGQSHGSEIQEEARSQALASSVWDGEHLVHPEYDIAPMDVSSPQPEVPPFNPRSGPMDVQPLNAGQAYPSRSGHAAPPPAQEISQPPTSKLSRLGFSKKSSKWGLGMFGHSDKGQHQHSLTPVIEVPGASSNSTPSLKRTQSSSSSLAEPPAPKTTKQMRDEAKRVQREAEVQRRALAEQTQREQARAVMQKRQQMLMQTNGGKELEWKWQHSGSLVSVNQRWPEGQEKGKQAASGPIRHNQVKPDGKSLSPLAAVSGRRVHPIDTALSHAEVWKDERMSKARRRDFDDDHSMSSSDLHSIERMSAISFATVDSDPGPSRIRNRNLFGIRGMASASSLRTATSSYDDYSPSAQSSSDQQFINDFRNRASVDTTASSLSGTSSPPPLNLLSLSPSPHPWVHHHHDPSNLSPLQSPYMTMPAIMQYSPHLDGSQKVYEYNGQLYGHPPSPAIDLQTAINPMFKVPPLPPLPPTDDHYSSQPALPPFSHLEAVAEGEYPPLSPMSFHSPEDDQIFVEPTLSL